MKKITIDLFVRTMEFTIVDGNIRFRAIKELYPNMTIFDMVDKGIAIINVCD